MSPRTVITWAENAEIFGDLGFAFRLTFLNKCDDLKGRWWRSSISGRSGRNCRKAWLTWCWIDGLVRLNVRSRQFMGKTIERMRANPKDDWQIDDVQRACREAGALCLQPNRGSHYKIVDPSGAVHIRSRRDGL